MRTALASSLNVPAVRTTDMVGVEVFADRLRRLGFSGLVEEGDYYGAALALGSADVTLWQLVNAYRTLANGGRYSELRLTTDADTQKSIQIYSPEASFVISDILSDRASRSTTFGLENSLATRYWSAVKTGTSKDMRDNWCVGYTDKFTVGVWVGNSSGAPMRDVTGITGAAPTWLNVMNYLHDRFGSGQIVRPPDVTLSKVSFPGAVEPSRQEWFVADTTPSYSPAISTTPISRFFRPRPARSSRSIPTSPRPRSASSSRPAERARFSMDPRRSRARAGSRHAALDSVARRAHSLYSSRLGKRAADNSICGPRRKQSYQAMIILTGGAGFIGSNLLGALNAKGFTDVLVVDRRGDNFRNLAICSSRTSCSPTSSPAPSSANLFPIESKRSFIRAHAPTPPASMAAT